MIESQSNINQWAIETFGECKDVDVMYDRFHEEIDELSAVILKGNNTKIASEMADCLIVLYRVASILNIDLLHEVDKKMHINRNRKWKLHGDGTGQHVD